MPPLLRPPPLYEPVASPTAAIERELAKYERELGTDVTSTPTATPGRPTGGVSIQDVHNLLTGEGST